MRERERERRERDSRAGMRLHEDVKSFQLYILLVYMEDMYDRDE